MPIIILYEISIRLAYIMEKKRIDNEEVNSDDPDDPDDTSKSKKIKEDDIDDIPETDFTEE